MPVPGGVRAGKISKPNGLQGKVNMILDPLAGKSIETDHPLFIDIDGQRVPFFVEGFEELTTDMAIVKFEFIENVEQARAYNGCEVYFDPLHKPAEESEINDLHAVIGYKAFDRDLGYLGKVNQFIESDFNPVLVIDYNNKELLVPAVDALIQQINHKEQSIHFHLPEGLSNL